MAQETIKIGMDLSDVKGGSAEFINALQQQEQAVFKLFEKMSEVNKQGEVTKRVIGGINDEGQKFEATLKKMGDGWEVVKVKVRETTSALQELKKAQEAAAAQAGLQRSMAGETALSGAFNLGGNTGFNFGQANTVDAAVQKIKASLADGKVSVERFQEILAKFQANPKGLMSGLTADEAKILASLRTIQNAIDSVAAAKQKAADKAEAASKKEAAAAEKAAKAMTDSGEKAKSMFISLGGIIRLLEAQVLKRIFGVLESEILGAVSAAQRFSVQIAEIRTISQDAQLTTTQWATQITDLSSKFGKSQADVGEGVYQTISNQVAKGADAFKFLETALGFSQATVSSATDSVNLLSGALKSFQLPATDAERVSAILFKTIELGRVRAKDMADTFGRVGTLAQDAGVKIEEVSAAVALLTNRGIKFNDASTLIQNVLLKLIRPTDEMKKLFTEWGVGTGTAAIATFGFSGVLQKLDAEAAKGTGRLGELLGQIRAIRGAVGLTGGAFNDYQKYLTEITGGQGQYEAAKKEVAESPGQRAMKELTQLRNFFEQDFGGPFLRGLLVISDALGGLVNITKGAIFAIQGLALGYAAFKLIQLANLPVMSLTIAEIIAMTAANSAGAVSWYGMAAAAGTFLTAIAPYAAAFGLAYVAGQRFFGGTVNGYNEVIAKAKEFEQAALKAREGVRKQEDARDDSLRENASKGQRGMFQGVLQFAAAVAREATALKEKAIANYRSMTEVMKISAGTYFESVRTKMKAFSDAISESKSLIKASLKESEDLERRGGQRIFDEKMKYASDGRQDPLSGMIFGDQKITMVKARITELANKAREEFGKGGAENVAEARKLFNDVERLQGQLFELETAKQRRTFDFQAQKGMIGPTGYDTAGKPYYEFVVKTAEMERQINKTTEERLELEQQFRTLQEARQKTAQEEMAREKERLRALQQQFLLLEKLDVFNKEGKVKSDYRGPEGMQKLLGEFDARREKIMELAGNDPREGFAVFRDLAGQRAALIQQVLQAMRAEATQQIQEGATRDVQTSERLITGARERLTEYRNDIERVMGGLGRQIALYETKILQPKLDRSLTGSAIEGEGFRAAEPKRQEALAALEQVKTARDAFNASGGRTEENARKLRAAIDALNTAMLEYVKLRGMDPTNTALAGDPTKTTLSDQAMLTGSVGRQIESAGVGISQAEAQLRGADKTASDMLSRFKEMPGAMDAMRQAAIQAAPQTQATFETLRQSAANYAEQLERINRALSRQAAQLPAVPREGIDEAEGNYFGGYAKTKYMNAGGFVGFVPRGSDQVPAMLGRDEFVMTSQATKQFMPLLKAMNSGTMPRYMNQGGPVTNVGDITVNVSGGQTEAKSIRNIAVGLRREILRGAITLDK